MAGRCMSHLFCLSDGKGFDLIPWIHGHVALCDHCSLLLSLSYNSLIIPPTALYWALCCRVSIQLCAVSRWIQLM